MELICEFEINSLRLRLAVVSQLIFNTSVRNNIAYAIEGADEAAIWEAARLANALNLSRICPKALRRWGQREDYLEVNVSGLRFARACYVTQIS